MRGHAQADDRCNAGMNRRGPYVAAEAIETLIEGAAAETSWPGIILTAGTLVICPWLGLAKQRIGEKLGSPAT
jgi:hypothetical protein